MIYDDIMEDIKAARQRIVKAKFRYQKVTVISQVMGFILGIAASLVATLLYNMS